MSTAIDNGIINKASNHSVEQTVDRLKNLLQSKGVTLFALRVRRISFSCRAR
jgi:uncharacterized protein (DUF302 family)